MNRASTFKAQLRRGSMGCLIRECCKLASDEGRIIVSHDENSMPGHFRAILEAGNHSAGVLIAAQGAPVGRLIESIVLWIASDAEEWVDRIVWLPV